MTPLQYTITNTMGEATKILRNSINAFFHSYNSFTSVTSLVFPVSAATLLSHALIASSPKTVLFLSSRLRSLFQSASFPVSSPLFSLLNLMLSQTVFSAVFAFPFALTFLVLAKASVIQISVRERKSPPPLSSLLPLYCPILLTHLFNVFVILSANAAVFSLLCLFFNVADVLALSSGTWLLSVSTAGAVIYSVAIGNAVVTCSLATVVSATEKRGGYFAFIKACVLIRGRVATALALALPTNLAMAAVEALFQYRVMRPYHLSAKLNLSIVWEGFTIAYIHSILVVFEIIVSCLFYKSCKSGNYQIELEPEDKCEV